MLDTVRIFTSLVDTLHRQGSGRGLEGSRPFRINQVPAQEPWVLSWTDLPPRVTYDNSLT